MVLPFRQIHLDFHTSEAIEGIGADFDAEEFAATLAQAGVNSVTCFARCHHGWIYYDTARFPERRHPHLTRNLLAEQIAACHARGIRVPIYVTVRWDHFTARKHPEWLVVDENGCIVGTKPYEAGFYRQLCLNTPYVDFLEEHVQEICELFAVDGFFFDIVFATPCSCEFCKQDMLAAGMDPADAAQRQAFAEIVLQRFQERMSQCVRKLQPQATIFYNSGHVGPRHRRMLAAFTHLELESLPSGGWGYMHFPVAQRYARTLGVPTLGMTGKFHTSWGDFSSYKNPAALEFECFQMLALGACCSIGDQLHPTGKIEEETYKLVGHVYQQVAAVEPFCRNAQPLAEVGVLTPEEFVGSGSHSLPSSIIGATRLLQELRQQFDILDSQADFSAYRLLILPDEIPVNEALRQKLSAYIEQGGAIIASYKSGLDPQQQAFNLPELGVRYIGPAPYAPDFIVAEKLGGSRPHTPQVMYAQGLQVAAEEGTQILSSMVQPYFNRSWRHFCSHRHTPPAGPASYPGATQRGFCIYFMHPIFSLYEQKAPLWCKELLAGAIQQLLPDPLVRAKGPSTLQAHLHWQPDARRYILHLLHYIPERRGREFDIIEDIIPLYNIEISLRLSSVSQVSLEPQGQALSFSQNNGYVSFVVPELHGHQLIVAQGE